MLSINAAVPPRQCPHRCADRGNNQACKTVRNTHTISAQVTAPQGFLSSYHKPQRFAMRLTENALTHLLRYSTAKETRQCGTHEAIDNRSVQNSSACTRLHPRGVYRIRKAPPSRALSPSRHTHVRGLPNRYFAALAAGFAGVQRIALMIADRADSGD